MTPTEPLLLVAIERSKRRHKLHKELEELAAIYIAGGDVRAEMQLVLDGLNSLHEINANNLPYFGNSPSLTETNEASNEDHKIIPRSSADS